MPATLLLLVAVTARSWTLDVGLPSRLGPEGLARGKALYEAFCQRCHGPDGDDDRTPGITPLAGLSLRLGDPRNRNFGGPAFRARGRVYPAAEASALMGYILTLRGAKGLVRPEALVSPCLLDRKRVRRTYLVLDVRPEMEFRKSHLPEAANLPPHELRGLRRPALAPGLAHRIVLLYDGGSGVQAACVWRALRASGHSAVAVLDGGFARWVAEDRETTPAISASLPRRVLVDGGAQQQQRAAAGGGSAPEAGRLPRAPENRRAAGGREALRELRFDPRRTIGERGLLEAARLADALREAGFGGPGRYEIRGDAGAVDLAAFELHLLGFTAEQEMPGVLTVR